MPGIRFETDDLEIEVPAGTSVARAAHEAAASLPFGCRAGTCSTCVVRVLHGAETLPPAGFVELDTLAVVGAHDADQRLACQIIVAESDLTLEW